MIVSVLTPSEKFTDAKFLFVRLYDKSWFDVNKFQIDPGILSKAIANSFSCNALWNLGTFT